MRRLALAATVSVFAFGSLFAQDELPHKHTSDDPPKTARLRIGTTKLRELDDGTCILT